MMNITEIADTIKFTPLLDTLKVSKIDDSEYFSNTYSKYVSNSRLSSINPEQGGSPEKFFKNLDGIYTDSILTGSAVHSIFLQPELFELVDTSRPTAKLGYVCDYIYDHSSDHKLNSKILLEASNKIDYYKGKVTQRVVETIRDAYRPYCIERETFKKSSKEPMFLPHKIYETAIKCIDACQNNIQFTKVMHPETLIEDAISENELAFTMDVKCDFEDRSPMILKLKSKLDNFVIDKESNKIIVNDLKTIGGILSKFDGDDGNFVRFHYAREMAIYLYLLSLYTRKQYNLEHPIMNVNCLVVSTIPDYYTKVYKVTREEINNGFAEFRKLLKLVAYYRAYEGYDFE